MADGEPTGLAEDCVSVSMLPAAQQVSAEEEEKDESDSPPEKDESLDELSLGQAEGVSRKKGRADADRRAMTVCVSSGGTTHGDYGFSDSSMLLG